MVYGLLNQGSGAGNQLFRMLLVRIKALELGVDWRMLWVPDNSGKPVGFKCKDFIEFDKNKIVYELPKDVKIWQEKKVIDEFGNDIRSFDPEYAFIEDETLIEGEGQDERYWEHREKEVNEWLKVEPLDMPSDVCVLAFRGGEFAVYPDLFLTKEYWKEAIDIMLKTRPGMKFEVHTDDVELARKFFIDVFPDWRMCLEYIHDIGTNWRSLHYAKYAITSNSSFAILPRWLKQGEDKDAVTISPRYWGRRNTKVWSLPQNFYKRFLYI